MKKLAHLARDHALELDLIRGSDSSGTPLERLVVHCLRHECTDYDADQSCLRHRATCEAIAQRFTWLGPECRCQIERRALADAEAERFLQEWELQREAERDEYRALVTVSKEAIGNLAVGQAVSFRFGRNTYTGTITKLGRSRVTVSYRIRTGRDRDRLRPLHATLVTPVEEET